MEKINKYYECLFVVDVTDGDEAVKATVEKFVGIINANAETVVEVAQWGKRRLAYPINYKTEGWYVLVTFKAPADLPRELERNLEIYDDVLRYLVVKLEVKRSNVKPRAPKAAPAVEAPVEAAETVEAPADAE